MAQGDQTCQLERVLKDIGQDNGARVAEQDLELAHGQLLVRHKSRVAPERSVVGGRVDRAAITVDGG